jgi:hypothetical protein
MVVGLGGGERMRQHMQLALRVGEVTAELDARSATGEHKKVWDAASTRCRDTARRHAAPSSASLRTRSRAPDRQTQPCYIARRTDLQLVASERDRHGRVSVTGERA